MASRVLEAAVSIDHVSRVLKSFDPVPYQVAIGGGEPTAHPDFPAILHDARELDCVPTFTSHGS